MSNDSFSDAQSLSINSTLDGSVGFGSDAVDYFVVEAPSDGDLTFNLTGIASGQDIDLHIFNGAQSYLAKSANGSGDDESVTISVRGGADYYAKVFPYYWWSESSYQLSFDFDPDVLPKVAILNDSVSEGGDLNFEVRLDQAASDIVRVYFEMNTGTAGLDDFAGYSGVVAIPAGRTSAEFSVATIEDEFVENDETMTVDLVAVSSNAEIDGLYDQAIGVIRNDDTFPTVSIGDASASEGRDLNFEVRLDEPSGVTVRAHFEMLVGSAGHDDFVGYDGYIDIPAGRTSVELSVDTVEDASVEADETMWVVLTDASNAEIGDGVGIGTIRNDDAAPLPSASISDASTTEGGTLNFEIRLDDMASETVRVDYEMRPGSAGFDDFAGFNGSIEIPAGQDRGVVSVDTIEDTLVEGDERMTVELVGAQGADLGDVLGVGTIADDDVAALPSASISDASTTEGGTLNFEIRLDDMASETVRVDYEMRPGSAGFDDFAGFNGSIEIPAGQDRGVVSVDTIEDTLVEGDERMTVELVGAQGADLGDVLGVGTILNDDSVEPRILLQDRPILGFRHMLLVLDQGETDLNEMRVIRGGPESLSVFDDLVVQADVAMSETNDALEGGVLGSEMSIDISDVLIQATGLSVAEIWDELVSAAGVIGSPDQGRYDYELPLSDHVANSNALIGSLLHHVGIDVREILTDAGETPRAPGVTSDYTLLVTRETGGHGLLDLDGGEVAGASLLGRDSIPDHLVGGGAQDFLFGDQEANGVSADTLEGVGGDDLLFGGGGDDCLFGGADDDSLFGGGIFDGDELFGGSGNDELFGGGGNDLLDGGAGDDSLDGGFGQDTVRFQGEVEINSLGLIFLASGDDGLDALSGVEFVEDESGLRRLTPFGAVEGEFWGGNGFSDVHDARGGDDTIWGHGGDDALWGRDGDDRIFAGIGDDRTWGGSGDDTIMAHYGHDNVVAGYGNDSVDGDAGNDTLEGNRGNDWIAGGLGDDSIRGGLGDDDIYAQEQDDFVRGDAGRDTIRGGAGVDSLFGGDGDDCLRGGNGDDNLYGGAANDQISGQAGDDELLGDLGADEMYGGEGRDDLYGQGQNDSMYGGESEDRLYGGDGDDLLAGDGEGDRVEGGNGADILNGNDGSDTVSGDAGDDRIFGGEDDDRAFGGAGGDEMWGGGGNDFLMADDGHDEVSGGYGADTIDGGAGNDRLDGNRGNDWIAGGVGADEIGGGLGDDDIWGQGQNDTIRGDEGDDTIRGGDGDDLLLGDAGDDSIRGGNGDDLANGGAANDHLSGQAGDDTLLGDLGADSIYGGWGADLIDGQGQADEVYGGGQNDTLDGGAGDDLVSGGDGDDRVDGGNGDDIVKGNDGADTISGGAGNDQIFAGADDDLARGGEGADLINGHDGADRLFGDESDDTVRGETGDDSIYGGLNDDFLLGQEGRDSLDGGEGADLLDGGADDDTLRGGAGDDELHGGIGADILNGGEGDDTLTSSAGDDTLRGGAGADLFELGPGAGNREILDFTFGEDEIDFDEIYDIAGAEVLADNLVMFSASVEGISALVLCNGPNAQALVETVHELPVQDQIFV